MAKTTTSSLGFNKRRAQGEDKIDGFKSFPLKIRKLNPVNTISYVQILGTGMDTQDTSPSVLLFFDKQRFIFNVGEGFQRYCTEHKIKLSKIDHILHSRVCSETVGGLPGLLLTLAGMGEQGMSVKLWGPSDLKILINGMLSFIPNDVVHATYFGSAPTGKFTDLIELIDDELVKISAILLRPSCPRISEQNKELSRCLGPLLPHLDNSKGADGSMQKSLNISVIYVCELPEIKGKFDPVKAKDHGLKPGPKYQQLQHGNSVMSDEKNVMIYPNDVLGPSIRGPIVLIVDCPTLHHLQELLSVQSLRNFYSDTKEQNLDGLKSVDCIIHLSPSSVTTTAMYQKWMNRFGGAQHIMAGHQIKRLGNPVLRASATISARLNYLCPRFFPAPGFPSSHEFGNFGPESNGLKEGTVPMLCDIIPAENLMKGTVPMLCDTIPAENLMKFHLRPCQQRGLDRSEVPTPLSQEEIINELVSEIPEIVDYKEQLSRLWVDDSKDDKRALTLENFNEDEHEYALPHCLKNITREDMEIVLLGTGSSQPSKHRNVSSIYLNLFSNGGLLLDCGEATLAQLIKRYGDTGADKELKKLKCIWISHIHADHHAGLLSILHRRSLSLNGISHEPLLVIGPWQLKSYLDAAKYLNVDFLDCRHTTEASLSAFESAIGSKENWVDGNSEHFKSLNRLKNLVKEAGLEGIISVPVVHCPHAFGIIVKAAERRNRVGETVPGWKLAYSGDTRPCQQLVNAARGATVLIHEATFEDGMAEEAVAKNHSTTKEAIEVGDSAGAYRIILTHFSQRYPKIPVFDDTHLMQRTCVAFDLMSINIADLPLLPKVLPFLKSLFQNEMIVDESVS